MKRGFNKHYNNRILKTKLTAYSVLHLDYSNASFEIELEGGGGEEEAEDREGELEK